MLLDEIHRLAPNSMSEFLTYFVFHHRHGKDIFQRIKEMDQGFLIQSHYLILSYYLTFEKESSAQFLTQTGRVYDALGKKEKILLLQAAADCYTLKQLTDAGWSIDLSKIKSAKQALKKNHGIIKIANKPTHPLSKTGFYRILLISYIFLHFFRTH